MSFSRFLPLVVSLALAAPSLAAPPPAKPNVLIIVLDTLRYDATSFGGDAKQTPFLASLAPRSVVFTNAYSTHDFTPPSHFALLTGLREGLDTATEHAQLGIAYEANRLGYDTFGTAANVLLSPKLVAPLAAFKRYTEVMYAAPQSEQATIGTYTDIDLRLALFGFRPTPHNRTSIYYSAIRMLPDFLKQLRDAKAPYVGFINLIDPHEPWVPNPAFYPPEQEKVPPGFQPDLIARRVSPEIAHPEIVKDAQRRILIQDKLRLVTSPRLVALDLTPEQLQTYRARYDAKVRAVDERLKEFFAAANAENLLNDTIVVITSDHGESFGEAGLITHNFKNRGDYESTHHVPLLLVLPPRFRVTKRVVTEKVSLADVAPTLYDLMGLDSAPLKKRYADNFGRSLAPLCLAKPTYTARVVVPDVKGQAATTAEEEEKRKALEALGYLQ